jgi:DNA-binding transcriptional MocR family regulator
MTISSEGTTLDPWYEHYASRTAGLSASEVRALFAVASRPEVVSLAGGMPAVSALPLPTIAASMERVMRERGPAALQYGSGQGTPELREQILEVMALEGIRAGVDDVVVTWSWPSRPPTSVPWASSARTRRRSRTSRWMPTA